MQYLIALDPQLGLSAEEFATSWNAGEYATEGTASVGESSPASFLAMEVTVALIAVATAIPATIIADFVTEYLKKKYIEKDEPKVTVTTISTPDGQPVWIIKKQEM